MIKKITKPLKLIYDNLFPDRDEKVAKIDLQRAESQFWKVALKNNLRQKISQPFRFLLGLLYPESFSLLLYKALRWTYRMIPIGEAKKYKLNLWFYVRFSSLFEGTEFLKTWGGTRASCGHSELPEIDLKEPLISLEEHLQFPDSSDPIYSLIVYMDGSLEETLISLKSLLIACEVWQYELLAISGLGQTETKHICQRVHGWRVITHSFDSAKAIPWELGARQARGEYVAFLRFPARVLAGWMEELAMVLQKKPDAGIVGSAVLFSDGKLQEAGCEISADGSMKYLGFGEDPLHTSFSHVQEVDFISAWSWMMLRDTFTRYDVFEDVSGDIVDQGIALATVVRAKDMKVLCVPFSRVILPCREPFHPNHVVSSGKKSFVEPYFSRAAKSRGNVLFMDAWTPAPDHDAGSLYLTSFFQIFKDFNYAVTFLPVSDLQFKERYTSDLQRMGVQCLYSPFVNGVSKHLQSQGSDYDLVFLFRAHCANHYLEMVRRHCPGAKVVFNTVDLHYLREQRQAEVEDNDLLRREAERTKTMELSVIQKADCTIILSSHEQDVLLQEPSVQHKKLALIPLIQNIPGSDVPFEERQDLLFIGGFEHLPNLDATFYFVERIWPLVRQAIPHITLYILGSKPTKEVKSLASKSIIVTGYISDIAPYFHNCRLSVAPLRYGAGLKGKVITSLSFGLPCVVTSIAVEGSGLKNGREVLIEDEPEQFALQIIRLHQDKKLWQTLSRNGLSFMENNYSFLAGKNRIQDMLHDLSIPY